ncbi:hypothetical protein JYU02_00020 [bacterium AH-315-P15]|nr:hypothetical protein [bacterium AH-315-P15]
MYPNKAQAQQRAAIHTSVSRSRKIIDWDGVAAAYTEGTATLKEIGAEFDVTAGSICHRAKLEGWPARARVTKRSRKPGATFEWRLARALDKQIAELEERWADGEAADAVLAEKEARTLNVLIRTAEKLKELEVMTLKKSGAKGDKENQGAARLDRKRLRETLERRLDKLIAAADARGLPYEPQSGGD